jgi:hypothetical protein
VRRIKVGFLLALKRGERIHSCLGEYPHTTVSRRKLGLGKMTPVEYEVAAEAVDKELFVA